jgi:IS4 transposase
VSTILAAFNTTAMVLGYISLAFIVGFASWIISIWLEKWKYKRRRARKNDAEWDQIRSAWLRSMDVERINTVEQRVIDSTDRTETAVLGITPEDIYDYEKEWHRDVS